MSTAEPAGARAAFSLARAAREAGERPALVFKNEHGEGSVSYAELARAGAELTDRFLALRETGSVLTLVATPDESSVVCLFAALDAGLPVLLLHPRSPLEAQKRTEDLLFRAILPPGAQILLETSGSTGAPKLVVHTHASLEAAARASAANLGWAEGDRWLMSLPFSHVGGLSILLRCFLGRRTTVLAPLDRATLTAEKITLVSLVPTQLTRLLDDPDFRFPAQVRQVLIGGASLTPELRARARQRSVPLLSTYGMTEFCSQICTEKPEEPGLGVGLPLPGTEVRLTAEGRIQARGPTACSGYLGAPSPFDAEGWLTTNDRGHWDERGHLHVLGRVDHMIISGGENIHPEAIEAVLGLMPEIASVGVVGLPDPLWGQKVVAAVTLYPSAQKLPWAQLTRRWHEELRLKLPSFALPKDYVLLEELPLLGIGKLDRAALTAQLTASR